ncbi:hypothetical protein CLOSTMETH_00077 [[Clostridium] methylpentosum DSM 5476]|jgi:hypothetical protein|uniref:DUF2304 domain-containing protein n=1 Tax=[Clostridium] methylpentosum DSM 5476 TaxID=537013 RepID=C0E8D2_9FIRM|nr:hypothetical protein CLOSTMETH_00077 [[Clostridium] methylpentosum DSM 5476]MDY3988495.1 DUF2304 domain-containing protein [Massilioclostridium sp.]MEE1490486.1 DUF2304 domain-containing protein [Massilioclostridium sp.]
MSLVLRILLIFVSLVTSVFMIKRIRQSKVQIEDTIFWIIFSALLIILSIFPGLADWMSNLIGIYSTVNFIFLFFIFILLVKMFLMTVRISQMDNKIKELTHKIAIDENLEEHKQSEE